MKFYRLLTLALSLGLSLWATNASAALLFSGGEDIDFLCASSGGCSISISGTNFRSAWAREAYGAVGTGSDPAVNRFATPIFAANSTIWIHAQMSGANGTTSGTQLLRILDSTGNPTLLVRGTGSSQQVKISSRTAGGVFTDLVTCSGTLDAGLQQLDLYVNYGAAGEVAIYKNSVQICDYTGNVTNGDGASTLNQVEFSAIQNSSNTFWSEVIVATTDTRAMARFTANTVANGNTVGFQGTNICSAIWNVTTANDANYGYTASSNVTHECTIRSSIPPGAYSVQGVVMGARALVGTTGPQHFNFVTRTGGTDYTSPDIAPTNSASNISNYIQATNPATSNPWSISELQDSGFNIGEKSKP